ncbi:MAG: type II toxin-antitoxin system Phd/YefM family antitoxin [Candidatus Electrothrix sp.]
MSITTVSSRAFNRDIGKAKKAAETGPVIITDRGHPAYVLMNIGQYREVTGTKKNILDLLTMPGVEDIEFTPPRMQDNVIEPADLS